MSILTSIDGMPLFSTMQEAIQWANSRGLSGYHTHVYNNQIGYMGGATHPNQPPASSAAGGIGGNNNTNSQSSPTTGSGGGGY